MSDSAVDAGPSIPPSVLLERILSVGRARLVVIGLTVAYSTAYAWIYLAFITERFEYFGFGYRTDWPIYDMVTVTLLCIAPSLWLPTSFQRPSAIFIYFQYFLIYIPAVWMTRHSVLPVLGVADEAEISVAMAASMAILIGFYHLMPLVRVGATRFRGSLLWGAIYTFAGLLLLILVAHLGGNFHLVNLSDIYSVRTSAGDLIEASGSVFITYAFAWLSGLLLPLIFARALRRSNYLQMLLVTGCYVFLFGIWGSKTALFMPLILAFASLWAARSASQMPVLMVAAFVLALIVPAFLPFEDGLGALIKLYWVAIVDMRTFSIPGLSIAQYYDFFATHPLTLGSHVTGVNWFIRYPYDLDVPRTIGYYYYGQELTANASFWAQDGLAAFGVLGIVMVSFVVALVLWILDSVTQGLPFRFVVTALVGTIVSFTNTSIFTTLLTGGLGLFMLASAIMPRSDLTDDAPASKNA